MAKAKLMDLMFSISGRGNWYKHTRFVGALINMSLVLLLSAPAYAQDLASMVASLGISEEKLTEDFDRLERDPHTAVALLVAQLHPIPRKAYFEKHKTKESRHVLACLRALHFLTGVTFSAKTLSKLTDDEVQFLDFNKQMHDENPDHKLHFFGVWMSRNAEFVAPEDAQEEIIKQWRDWQKQFGASFSHKPKGNAAQTMEDWVWYG